MGLSVHTNGDGAGDNPLQAYYTTAVHSAITASACIVYTIERAFSDFGWSASGLRVDGPVRAPTDSRLTD